jgi:hypothetical protein
MKRRLLALVFMLAVGLQSSVIAVAAITPVRSTDCHGMGMSHPDAARHSCCPKGQHTMSGCLEACCATVAGPVSATTQTVDRPASATQPPDFRTTHISSRGDSPLIRPPIL